VTFCSVRKFFLAVPNAVCCSAEHRRPDNNLAAKTSKNKSRSYSFFPLQRNIAASHVPPSPNCQASSGRGAACAMLNSKIVSFWFSARFRSENGAVSQVLAVVEEMGKQRSQGGFKHLLLVGAAQRAASWGVLLGTICGDGEVRLELTRLFSGVVDNSCCCVLGWFKLGAPSPLSAAGWLPGARASAPDQG